ncbi:HAD-IIB family hydrolase [Rothia uropygialis]|uniref:HAD-IIB family hydrolase n=1 Tax=Kocuria sp. 36 TaxID=1415402 RepID=UPI00101C012C|nr:HAD-IIB family hydrolase [Kocuria sp. 36]
MENPAVFDVDGTICFDGHRISEDIVEALRELRGFRQLIFASARPLRDLVPVIPTDLQDQTLIGGNGAFVRHAGQTEVVGFRAGDRRMLDELIDAHEYAYLLDGPWDYAYTGDADHRIFRQLDAGRLASHVERSRLETYSKAVLFTEDAQTIDRLRRAGLTVTHHPAEGLIDVAPSGISKFAALSPLRVSAGSYTAFGNDANDVDLLRNAEQSYCVGDHPSLSFAEHFLAPGDVARAIRGLTRARV